MEYTENIYIFIIPCYYKRQIKYRPEVATFFDTCQIHRQPFDGTWEAQSYNSIEAITPSDYMQYETETEAIKAAQDFVEQLKSQ